MGNKMMTTLHVHVCKSAAPDGMPHALHVRQTVPHGATMVATPKFRWMLLNHKKNIMFKFSAAAAPRSVSWRQCWVQGDVLPVVSCW